MGESKRRKDEIAALKAHSKDIKAAVESELRDAKKARHGMSAREGVKEFVENVKHYQDGRVEETVAVEETFVKKDNETFAEFTHRILNGLTKITEDMVSEVLTAGTPQIIGSEVFPGKEQVVLYYKDQSCLRVTFLHNVEGGGDALKIESGRGIVIPAHVKTLQ